MFGLSMISALHTARAGRNGNPEAILDRNVGYCKL